MTRFFLFIVLIVTTCYISSCIDILPSKSNNPNKVVVNCLLNDSDNQVLTLTNTFCVEEKLIIPVTNAKVYLYNITSEKLLVGSFYHIEDGLYTLSYRPIPENTYLLEIELENGVVLTATTEMPKIIPFIPISINRLYSAYNNKTKNGFTPDFYYPQNSTNSIDNIADFLFIGDKMMLPHMVLTTKLTCSAITDKIYNNIPREYKMTPILTLSKYIQDDVSISNKINPADNNDIRYWLYFKITKKIISVNNGCGIIRYQNLDSTVMTAINFKTISNEYNEYISSVMEKAWTFQDPTNLSSMFDISKIYTNISGGYGIFGAYSEITCFYKGSYFTNFYISQTRENITREMIIHYILSIDWDNVVISKYDRIILEYVKWLRLNQ